MKRQHSRRAAAALVLLVAVTAACARPASITTPAGKRAWDANEVVIRINELQAAVIDASDIGQLPVATARPIVEWTVKSLRAIQDAPESWQAVAIRGWADVRPLLVEHPKLGHWTIVIDVLLGVI